jgi:HEPN/Toprim N-terminal domain 1
MIHLAVGRLEIDWGKNDGFVDHGPLFQVTDVAQVPYYYVDHHDGDYDRPKTYIDASGEERYQLFAKYKDGMSKPLWQVVERIRLLGYTLESCEAEFRSLAELNNFDTDRFPFELLKQALATVDVRKVSADYGEMGENFGKFFRRELYPRLGFEAIADDPDYVRLYAGEGMENLSAYTVLQLLAFNPSAADLPVTWQFADVENGGWAEREDLVRELDPEHRFLIVTEGSSDARIIRHAFELLRPHIADFFDFVDMEEGYPFAGTGNVHKFLQGLISISIQNSVVVLYDNDAEGVWSYRKSNSLNLPENIRVLKLPDSPTFVEFDTVGPGGRFMADINGQAAAIECYLDLGADALVRWTNFKSETETYQGELLGKTGYMRTFLGQKARKDGYDYSRIEVVLDLIIDTCAKMRSESHKFD